MFKNRFEAGKELAQALQHYQHQDCVVVAVPRGGVVTGYAVAKQLGLPLEVVLSKKLGHPTQKEFAIGAVNLDEHILDWTQGVMDSYIEHEIASMRDLLRKRKEMYYGNRQPENLEGRIAIIVDDGIATGNTILASIRLIRRNKPLRIVVAVPVAPAETKLRFDETGWVDEFVCLLSPANFHAVGQFYEIFEEVTDEEIVGLLQEANQWTNKIEQNKIKTTLL
ncbi:MAG: phosphoribosyltransferase family protein [Saprospiraceae bacterium]